MTLSEVKSLWVSIASDSPRMNVEEILGCIKQIVPDLIIDRNDKLLDKALRSIERASQIAYSERLGIMPIVLSDIRLWLTHGPHWNFKSGRPGLLKGFIRPRSLSMDFGDGLEQNAVNELRELCLGLPGSEERLDGEDEVAEHA